MITAGLSNRVLAVDEQRSNPDDNSVPSVSDNSKPNNPTDDKKPEEAQPQQQEQLPSVTTNENLNPDVKPDTPVHPSQPDNDCLFHPELDKCKSDNGKCPDGFFQNGHESCVPNHEKCPKHFHSHEDDETGRCIPDSVQCEPGFIRNPDFPTCSSKTSVCRDHPELKVCGGKGNDNHVIVIHKTKTIHKSDISNVATVFVKGVGLVEPFNCKLNKDTGKIGCEFLIIKVIH